LWDLVFDIELIRAPQSVISRLNLCAAPRVNRVIECAMFFFFSNGLGVARSIALSVIVTLIILKACST
jgi:hypothetical protein